jgi:hypothetical protein
MACPAPKTEAAITSNLFMQTPKDKFSVGSLLGVFGLGKKSRDAQYQDTVFSDTLQNEFEDTSPGVLHTQDDDAAVNPQIQINSASAGKKS